MTYPDDCSMYVDDTMAQRPGTTLCDVNNVIADDIENLSSWFNNNNYSETEC